MPLGCDNCYTSFVTRANSSSLGGMVANTPRLLLKTDFMHGSASASIHGRRRRVDHSGLIATVPRVGSVVPASVDL